jgi:lipid-binding SYLF domain-containing protein
MTHDRRRFLLMATLLMAMACLALGPPSIAPAQAATEQEEIDSSVKAAIAELYKTVPGSEDVAKHAYGILVFPAIYKAGIGIGGQYGKGALRVHGKSVGYYNTVGASFGFQLGAEKRSMALMFMTTAALQRFEHSSGWDAGGDASVTLVEIGANGAVDASRLNKPVVAFLYGNTGLMYNLSLKGTKISKLDLPASSASGSSTPKEPK